MRLQFRGGKRPNAEDLVHFPLDDLESGKPGLRIGIAGGDALGLLARRRANHVNAELAVGARPGEKDATALMLLFHPDKMLVESHGPLLARPHRPAQDEIPHGNLLRLDRKSTRLNSSHVSES